MTNIPTSPSCGIINENKDTNEERDESQTRGLRNNRNNKIGLLIDQDIQIQAAYVNI